MRQTLFRIGLAALIPAALLAQAPKTFDSAESAAQALVDAAANNDTTVLAQIFGPKGKDLFTSGNTAQDQSERAEFAQVAKAKHHLAADPMSKNRMILYVGSEDWPFPAPLVNHDGKWSFDAAAGTLEMHARHIGRDELDAIEISAGYVSAQKQYAALDRDKDGLLEYAQHLMSTKGKQDGLYWDMANPLVPQKLAQAEGPGAKSYHGYYFRVLSSQGANAPGGQRNYMIKECMIGGFALVAWPAEYGVTGIHTFIVNQDGIIYEKDLGAPASNKTAPLTVYDPDSSWTAVDETDSSNR